MGAQTKIRMAIVDDHPMVREGLKMFLQLSDQLELVGTASSGQEAMLLADREPLDVLLMDLLMPGEYDGIAAIRAITAGHPEIRIIALTSSAEPDHIRCAIEAGASGYVQKDVHPDDLLAIIRQAALGRSVLDPAAMQALRPPDRASEISRRRASTDQGLPCESQANPCVAASSSIPGHLTLREQEVLEQMALGSSNKEIAAALGIAEKTVKVHVSHILAKLDVYDRTQAILSAGRKGWVDLSRAPGEK